MGGISSVVNTSEQSTCPRLKPTYFYPDLNLIYSKKFSILSVRARFGGKSTGYIQIKEEEGMRKEVHFEKTKTQNGHDHPCEFVSSWASSRHLVLETQLCRDDVIGRYKAYLNFFFTDITGWETPNISKVFNFNFLISLFTSK